MAMHPEDLRINPPSPNVVFLAVDQWWFSVSGAAADHHAGRGCHEDHVRCSSVSPGVQQRRGVRQAPAGVQLQSLSGREDLRSDILKISMMEAEIDPSAEPMVVDSSSDCGPLTKTQSASPLISSSKQTLAHGAFSRVKSKELDIIQVLLLSACFIV